MTHVYPFDARKEQALAGAHDFDRRVSQSSEAALAALLNEHKDYFLATRCSVGRLVVLADGRQRRASATEAGVSGTTTATGRPEGSRRTRTGTAGESAQYLYTSDSPLKLADNDQDGRGLLSTLFGDEECRNVTLAPTEHDIVDRALVRLRFEPTIVEVEARSLEAARQLVGIAIDCGYSNSSLVVSSKRHLLTIRDDVTLDVPIAYQAETADAEQQDGEVRRQRYRYDLSVPIGYLRTLIVLANRRFHESDSKMTELTRSIAKTLSALDNGVLNTNGIGGRRHVRSSSSSGGGAGGSAGGGGGDEQRRERRRGLSRHSSLRHSSVYSDGNDGDVSTVDDEIPQVVEMVW